MKVSYGPNLIEVTVISGYARLQANKGVKGTLMWSGGKPRRTDPSLTKSSVDSGVPNVCGPIGAAPAVAGTAGLLGIGTAGTALLFGGAGVIIVAILVASGGTPCPPLTISNVQPCVQ